MSDDKQKEPNSRCFLCSIAACLVAFAVCGCCCRRLFQDGECVYAFAITALVIICTIICITAFYLRLIRLKYELISHDNALKAAESK